MQVSINGGERVFVSGKTGSGKSALTKKLIFAPLKRAVFYDWKWEHNDLADKHPVIHTTEDLNTALNDKPEVPKVVFRPKKSVGTDFNEICRIVYQRGNTHLIVDEARKVTSPNQITEFHSEILALGRTRNVGITNLTQRPRVVHNDTMAEAEHYFLFQQQLETDREQLREVVGNTADLLNQLPERHSFVYYHESMERGKIIPPLNF